MLSKEFFKKRPLLIGHRGSPVRTTENSLPSFEKALEEGVDMVEFDVRLSRDHEVVVFHDKELNRLTGQKGFVRDSSLKELQVLRLGFSNNLRIPTLADVLEQLGQRVLLYIELKVDEDMQKDSNVLALKTLESVEKYKVKERCILVSFNYHIVKWIKQQAPYFFTGLNFSDGKDFALAEQDDFKYIDCLCPQFSCLNEGLADLAQRHSLEILTWVVNDEVSLQRAIQLGVLGIATDDPSKLAQYLKA